MSGDSIFSRRLLIGWLGAAMLALAVSLYFMGNGAPGTATVGPSTFSRSAIGYAGIADVLQRLDLPVVKSRYGSLGKLTPGSVLVLAEPLPDAEEMTRTLLKADTVLLVLPKWTGPPDRQKPTWLGEAMPYALPAAAWALHLVAPRAGVVEVKAADFGKNLLDLPPRIAAPIHLMHGDNLQPIVGDAKNMLLGQITQNRRRIWVLADPDLMSNRGLAQPGNAALAVAIFERLRRGSGRIVFDETIHGFESPPASPLRLLFRFPFVIATVQAAIAIALLLWATVGRFGTPQQPPAPVGAGRKVLLETSAELMEYTGHQGPMIERYVDETVREVGRQLHAPRGLATAALVEWLQRVGTARGVATDCGKLMAQAALLGAGRRRNPAALARLAREAHRWKEEVLNGRSSHPRSG